jgi:uncharacterized membrane protein YhiD involved in acid resistance
VAEVFDYLKEFNFASVVVRLLLAMVLGGLIGLAVGAGFYGGAILGTGLVLLAETLFSYFLPGGDREARCRHVCILSC